MSTLRIAATIAAWSGGGMASRTRRMAKVSTITSSTRSPAARAGQGWLTAAQMLDGLGLAETTPGPLVLVFQFVGGIAGAGFGITGGLWLGMAMVLWVTFAPSFLWIFTLAPHLDRLTARPAISRSEAGRCLTHTSARRATRSASTSAAAC